MPLLRIALAALAVVSLAPSHTRAATHGAGQTPAPGPEDLKRAERLITRLRQLEDASAAGEATAAASAFRKFYPALFSEVASLREGDLKTDLTTAVFLHDAAYRARASLRADCDAEARELYRKLCLENEGVTPAALLRAKAGLHERWAEALVSYARGRRDAATSAALAEMRSERAADAALAARALAALTKLEASVNAYPSLAAFEEGRAVAKVSYRELSSEVSATLLEVDRLLAALPRGPVRQLLTNARNSYRDGLFWWAKTRARDERTVAADAPTETDQLDAARLDPAAARYTVVVNWRNALRYTARAADLIRASAVQTVALRAEP
jgi:hypothetical protein